MPVQKLSVITRTLCLVALGTLPTAALAETRLNVPEGFAIEALDFKVPNARQIALTEQGALIIGTRRKGVVYKVENALSENPGKPQVILDNVTMPSGVTVHKGDAYIGATHEIIKIANIDSAKPADPVRITSALPKERHHGWKYLKFGPDGHLYFPVGAPCNICLSEDPRFASILRMDADGSTEVWAHGVRNSVGFAWHPQTGQLWFSDNGRDMLGDDIPPEEINILTKPGEHFGYPFQHASGIADPEFGDHSAAGEHTFTEPAVEIQAHSAALGMTFYTATQFPEQYHHALFVAEHGSWNRSSKVGYQVSVITTDADGNAQHRPFVTGWLKGQKDWGRPNDVLLAPDGSLLISDDKADRIYRVRYTGKPVTL